MIEWAFLVVFLACLWYFSTRLPDNYPPTPPVRLPILGHAHYLFLHKPTKSTAIYELFRRYSKNGILTLHIGILRFTIIGTPKLVKDLFSNEETNMRPTRTTAQMKIGRQNLTGTEGIAMNHGKNWQEQRTFSLTTLKNFGIGKTNIEESINLEVSHFCKHMENVLIPLMGSKDQKDRPMNIFHIPILNILWDVVAGERYDYEDPKLVDFNKKITAMLRTPFFQPSAAIFLPFLGRLFPNIDQPPGFGAILEMKEFLSDTVKQHVDTFDPNNIRDFIDMYLLQIQEKGVEGSSFHPSQGYEQLLSNLLDFIIAGSETSSNTLSFAVLFMVNNQEVQLKMRQEIFDVIGCERQPCLADKVKMPYSEAVVMECQRHADIGPDGVPHETKSPLKAGPYIIPPGHTLMSSFTAILKSDQEWIEPDKFNPNRFIEDGRVKKPEAFMPFSAGKRQCLGESLAKAELFLFLIGLIQKFHFETMQPGKEIEIVVDSGQTRMPLPTNPIKVTKIN